MSWSAATGYSIFSSPAVANGAVYVGSEDNNIYAFAIPPATSAFFPAAALAPPRPDPATLLPHLTLAIQPERACNLRDGGAAQDTV